MVDLYTISVILFFSLLAILIYKDRKNIEFRYVLVIRRTKKFRNLIDGVARLSPRLWKLVYTVAIAVCFYYMLQGFWLLLYTADQIATGVITKPALSFILPTPASTGASGPGYILIPFWLWLVTIALILVPHEFSHGLIARAEKIRLKSVGLLLLLVLPGAFVEPDDRQLKRAKTLTKLRIFSAGSFANFFVAMAVFLATMYLVWPAAAGSGIILASVNETSPAGLAGLEAGMTVTEANGIPITSTYQEYTSGRGYLWDEIGPARPGDTVSLVADGRPYDITLAAHPETNYTYMGITYGPALNVDPDFFFVTLIPLLTMVWLFSFAVGLINILPLYPLDGGLMIEALADKYAPKLSKRLVRALTWLVLLVLIFDFIGPSFLAA